jgi:hypothetical protein
VSGTLQLLEFLKKIDTENNSLSKIKRVIEQGGVEINGKKLLIRF